MRTILLMLALVLTEASITSAQPIPYGGPLLYQMPLLKSVPPLRDGQSAEVVEAYQSFDHLLRTSTRKNMVEFLRQMPWGDTAKWLASKLYLIQDDDPIAFYRWISNRVKPDPYNGNFPGYLRTMFQNRVGDVADSSGRTGFLLASNFILDITVGDTLDTHQSDDPFAPKSDMVMVKASINEAIKGRYIPITASSLALSPRVTVEKGSYPMPRDATAASPSANPTIQFVFSPQWSRQENDDERSFPMVDAQGGRWFKPGVEYIVFFYMDGISVDSQFHYFTLKPFWGAFGNSGGAYPVVDGIVQDPYDDFRLGGVNLPVAEWKSRLRARIEALRKP